MLENEKDRLLDPQKSYREYYQAEFRQNAAELFESLVKKSKIDIEENRKTSRKYRALAEQSAGLRKKRRTLRIFKGLCIALAAVSVGLCIYGIDSGNDLFSYIPIPLFIGALVVIFAVLQPKIRLLTEELAKSDEAANAALVEANRQVSPLLRLFDSTMTTDLLQKTLPTLKIDNRMDMRRYDYLHGKYGLPEEESRDSSTLRLLSGEILGNPFFFQRNLIHRMGTQAYTGTLPIHWVTYTRDQNGRTVAQHHTQILTATVVKPKPFFSPVVSLVYGNEAAPDLSFTHKKTHAEGMNERKLNAFVRKRTNAIQKKAEKNMSFTEMGNEKFDAVFGAIDRDNEVQFRLLFTPLAQKNMLDLMTKAEPYGDDFDFYKKKCLNIIVSEHAQRWDMETDTEPYFSYDADIVKENFLRLNAEYFKNFFFDLAPLLSIPLYQQHEPKAYEYQKSYERNYPAREAELMANKLGDAAFAHPASVTPAILKTDFLKKKGAVDLIAVTAYSYRTVHRTDFVPTLGGDGHLHTVPVPWLEYIPLTKKSEMSIEALEMTESEYLSSPYATIPTQHDYFRRLFATVGRVTTLTDESPDKKDEDGVDYGDIVEASMENLDSDADENDE